ncbi:hypothetical protein Rs2_19343 [Raphanus sativus]|nr:hypothetical protein Rs2_19343 [Raphanus sativus]
MRGLGAVFLRFLVAEFPRRFRADCFVVADAGGGDFSSGNSSRLKTEGGVGISSAPLERLEVAAAMIPTAVAAMRPSFSPFTFCSSASTSSVVGIRSVCGKSQTARFLSSGGLRGASLVGEASLGGWRLVGPLDEQIPVAQLSLSIVSFGAVPFEEVGMLHHISSLHQ